MTKQQIIELSKQLLYIGIIAGSGWNLKDTRVQKLVKQLDPVILRTWLDSEDVHPDFLYEPEVRKAIAIAEELQ